MKDKKIKDDKDKEFKKTATTFITILSILLIGIFAVINNFLLFIPLTFQALFKVIHFIIIVIFASWIMKKMNIKADSFTDNFENNPKIVKKIIPYIIALVCICIIPYVYSSGIMNADRFKNLAGNITTENFSKDISVVDLQKLPIINQKLAENLADKKIGELSSLGSQMRVGNLTLQNVNGTLYYVAPLEFTGFFKWWDNNGISPGYIKVNAQAENDVELVTSVSGKDLQIKYLEDSYWGDFLERKAYSFVKTQYLDDYTFEIDDEGNPYWVITKYDKTIGLSGDKTSGCLIIDAQTGEGKEYSINDTPKWVDRLQPTDMTIRNLNYAGKYVHGFFNSITSKKNLTKTAEGINVIYNNNECYYYTGVTSVGKDESLIGFYLTDTRTGETKMYQTAGAVETSAMASAQGKVNNITMMPNLLF